MSVAGFVSLAACVFVVALVESRPNTEPCQPPPLTSGYIWVTAAKGLQAGGGTFSYDSPGKRVRFTDDPTLSKKAKLLDVLFLIEQGIFYEIDSKASTCKKRPLTSLIHPMEVQPNMSNLGDAYLGSRAGTGLGVNMRTWSLLTPQFNGAISISTTTVDCLTLSATLFTQTKDMLLFTFMEVVKEVKDPQAFVPPTFCEDVPLEKDGDSFFGVFLNQPHIS